MIIAAYFKVLHGMRTEVLRKTVKNIMTVDVAGEIQTIAPTDYKPEALPLELTCSVGKQSTEYSEGLYFRVDLSDI
jgi:hypothetical protein